MEIGLSVQVGRAFYGNFSGLRHAQAAAVQPIKAGDDVVISSGTGSGKTEAALAPLLDRYLQDARSASGCTIAYITPTRALANDLLRRVEPPLEQLGLTAGIRHGERNDLDRVAKPDVLITTPESFDVLVMANNEALGDLRAVVLDEVHLLYNQQRGLQAAILLRRAEQIIDRPLQVVALSATVGDPTDLWSFFRPGRGVRPVLDRTHREIQANLRHQIDSDAIVALLGKIVAGLPHVKVLLFVQSKRVGDTLTESLASAGLPLQVFLHHASLAREVRLIAEQRFLQAGRAVCVATATLELGIDIGDIDLVMLFGSPPSWQSFLQRIGRGNRRTPKTNVECLVPAEEPFPHVTAGVFVATLNLIDRAQLETAAPLALYGAAVQQLASRVMQQGGGYVRRTDLETLLSPWPHLHVRAVNDLLDAMIEEELFVEHPVQRRVGPGPALHDLHERALLWGNFPRRSHEITLLNGGRPLGRVPATNLAKLAPGVVIRFNAATWRVERVTRDGADLTPIPATHAEELSYGRGSPTVEPDLLEGLLAVLCEGKIQAWAPHETATWLGTSIEVLQAAGLRRDTLLAARIDGRTWYLTFAGKLMNLVIARWAGFGDDAHAVDVALGVDGDVPFGQLPATTDDLRQHGHETMVPLEDLTIYQSFLPTSLRRAEFLDGWGKTPVWQRSLDRLRTAEVIQAPPAALRPWVPS